MDFETLEKILTLFDDCQSRGKPLQINIDEDLVKILPLPRKLILDFLLDPLISNFFRLSNDQTTLDFQNNLRLCPTDQNEGGSCHSLSCEQLHICKNYLLNNKCSEFQSYGKCSRSHSLSTNHNENILKKLNFSSKDENIFQLISHLIKLSSLNSSKIILQTINKQNITDDLIDQLFDQHKSLLKDQKLLNSYTIELTFDDDEVASMMEDYLIQHHSTTIFINKNFLEDLNKPPIERLNLGRGRGRLLVNSVPLLNNQSNQNTFSRRLASTLPMNEKKISFSQRLNTTTTTNDNSSSQIKTKSPELTNDDTDSFSPSFLPKTEEKQTNSPQNKSHFILRGHSTKTKEKPLITYNYNKPFIDEHLCYLLGPGKKLIIEKDQCQILSCLPFGYCKVKTNEQGKDIEKYLYSILPETLNIDIVKTDNHLSLIICSSIAEYVFQQNQMYYAIVSEPAKVQLNIEVIHTPSVERKQSPEISRRTTSSFIDDESTQQSFSNGKFHINTTDSSIDVISGDITQTPVDMMICISTSNNLRDSVLRCAGPKTESEYKARYHSTDALLLDGGLTAAQKILFVPWQTDIEETETTKTQKSLSDLVRWCIDQAHQRKMKSISFPPIGTGQLGLDPAFVCEAMISAASERLHQYKIDVLFVIYSSTRIDNEDLDECYQVFKIYLDSLCQQIKSTPTMDNGRKLTKIPQMKKESIRRDVQSKRILALSDSSNIDKDYNLLIKSLEDLMYEKTFDLSLIESSLLDQIDLLIDICLKSNVYPHIDYSREELILRGDRDSCFQCFFNLRQNKKIYQYSYVSTEQDETIINSFISLKIDEALAVGESNISVKDNDQVIFNIDFNKLEVRLNKDKKVNSLVRKQLNGEKIKIRIPSSWSSSLLMIRTIEIPKSSFGSLKCFQAFEETMPISEWQIDRIESIENYPLFLHFMNSNKNEKPKLYFHGCSYSSVQSIIHYGLHSTNASNYGDQYDHSSICLTSDVLNSHLYGTRRSTDGKYYIFAVELTKNDIDNDLILLSNDETHLALPTYLIVYQRQKHSN